MKRRWSGGSREGTRGGVGAKRTNGRPETKYLFDKKEELYKKRAWEQIFKKKRKKQQKTEKGNK